MAGHLTKLERGLEDIFSEMEREIKTGTRGQGDANLILFQSLVDVGLSKEVVRMIQGVLFIGGGIWSTYLAVKLHGGWGIRVLPDLIGIGIIALLWQKVLF